MVCQKVKHKPFLTNHLLTLSNAITDFVWTPCIPVPEINTLVSSTRNINLESIFISTGKLLMYHKNNN
jgi:hypothetical protein